MSTEQSNIYNKILAASKRAYQLRRGYIPMIEPRGNVCSTAMAEVESGVVGMDILLTDEVYDPSKRHMK